MTEPLEYEITNVGGVEHASLTLRPGLNILRGPNGCGKTSSINAVARLHGSDVSLERRDGTDHGTISGPGGVLVRVGQVVRSKGDASLSIVDTTPVSTLIDPGLKASDAAARARLRALVNLVGIGMEDDTLAALAPDESLRAWLRQSIEDDPTEDVMVALNRLKHETERRAREQEAVAESQDGRISAATERAESLVEAIGGRQKMVSVSVDDARQALIAASGRYEREVARCEAREDLEARQAEFQSLSPERPDVEAAEAKKLSAQDDLSMMDAAVHQLEVKLAEAKAQQAGFRLALESATEDALSVKQRADEWDAAQAILARPVEGPTRDQLDALKVEIVNDAEMTLEAARISEEYAESQKAFADAVKGRDEAQREGERLRKLAKGLPARLAEILDTAGAPGITVVDGRVCAFDGDRVLDWERRLSDGQRIYRALDLAARRWPGGVVALSGQFWTALDPEHRGLIASAAAERGLFVVTEEADDGELRTEWVG